MNLTLNLIVWGVLLVVVIALYIYHHWLENRDDHYIHLHGDSHDTTIVNSQTAMAKRIDGITKLRNLTLLLTILYGVAIAGWAIYTAWNNTNNT